VATLGRIILVGGLALLLAGCGHKAQPVPIWVGQVAPAAGADFSAGAHARQGVELAVEEANQKGGFAGDQRVRVLHPEAGSSPEAVRGAAVRLITVDRVAGLLGGTDPVQVDAMREGVDAVAETARVPLVAAGGTRDEAPSGFVFHVGVAPGARGETLAQFAAEQFSGKTLAVVVADRDHTGQANTVFAERFTRQWRKSGGPLAGEWTFAAADELKDRVKSIAAAAPGALVLAGTVEDLETLHREGLDEKTPVVLGGPEGSLAALRAHPLANRVYLATAFVADVEAAPARDFVRRYRERFQEEPDVHAALAYDGAHLLFQGLRQAQAVEGVKVRDALAGIKTYPTVTGEASLNADHWTSRPLYVLDVANGQGRLVKTFAGQGEGQ
jgi:branched-chain amino acid transport system substrate-binding protein